MRTDYWLCSLEQRKENDMGVYKIKNLKVSDYTDKLFVTEYDKEGYILRRYWIKREDLIECEGEEDERE